MWEVGVDTQEEKELDAGLDIQEERLDVGADLHQSEGGLDVVVEKQMQHMEEHMGMDTQLEEEDDRLEEEDEQAMVVQLLAGIDIAEADILVR